MKRLKRASGKTLKNTKIQKRNYTLSAIQKKRKHMLPKQNRGLYILAVLSGLGLLGSIMASLLGIFVFTAFSSTLPSPTKLTNRSVEQSTRIFDRNNELLYSVYDNKNRTLVTLSDVSPYLINATLAAEDADFYKHQGIDLFGIARSVFITLTTKGKQGGSTLTQQVAKNALLSTERTLTRKVKDIVLALQIENSYSKDEILQLYLNEVPYGGTTWGIEAASKTYFAKGAKDVNLAEAALLAGLPQRPSYYSPFRDPEVAKNRQRKVLQLMHERGWLNSSGERQFLSDEEYNAALEVPLEYAPNISIFKAPHFVQEVLTLLKERYGEDMVDNGGLAVKTTLDFKLYQEYQTILQEEVEKSKSLGFSNAGLVAIEPESREVLAMIGSKDYFAKDIDGQFNVTKGLRQPGSALKPFTYLTGLVRGFTAASVLYDVSTQFPQGEGLEPYAPENYGNWGYRGPMQVRYALANSVNTSAVKMLDLVGIPNMVKVANDLGIKSLEYDPSKHGLALTLGGGEVTLLDLTNGYASLASGGESKDPIYILEVKDHQGNVLERQLGHPGKQVVDERAIWIISDILTDNNARAAAFGTRSQLYIPGNKVGVKTGTTNDLKDNWTVGFTRDLAVGVWVGNNDGKPMNIRLASGLTGAAPIWNKAMNSFLKDHPHPEFPRPDGVVDSWVGRLSGMVPYEDKEERRVEYFIEGTQPKSKSEIFQRVKICKDDKIKDKLYIVYETQKEEWQGFLTDWIKNKYKDDEDNLFKYLGPEYEKDKKSDRFDLDDCGDDDDDDD